MRMGDSATAAYKVLIDILAFNSSEMETHSFSSQPPALFSVEVFQREIYIKHNYLATLKRVKSDFHFRVFKAADRKYLNVNESFDLVLLFLHWA